MDEQRILADQTDGDTERPRSGTMHPEPIRPIETLIVGPATIESLSEHREKLKKHLAAFPRETLLGTLTPCDVLDWIEHLFLAHQAEQLWQELRLTSYLIAKLKLIWRTAVSSSKKAVSERCFFVLHETHPPELSWVGCGLLVGAFQAA